MKVSIVIPVFNEIGTLPEIVARVESAEIGMDKEIIIVDDMPTVPRPSRPIFTACTII